MPAPDYTAEIAALELGLASGEARIESDGDTVIYRGVADIRAAIGYFQTKAAQASSGAPVGRPASTLATFMPV